MLASDLYSFVFSLSEFFFLFKKTLLSLEWKLLSAGMDTTRVVGGGEIFSRESYLSFELRSSKQRFYRKLYTQTLKKDKGSFVSRVNKRRGKGNLE